MKRQCFYERSSQEWLTLLYILCIVLFVSACQRRTLEEAVAQANSHCPYEMGKAGKIVSVALADGYVTFTYDWKQSVENFERLRNNVALATSDIEMLLSDPDGDTKEMLNLIAAEGKGVRYVFRHSMVKNPVVEEISSARIKDFLSSSKTISSRQSNTQKALSLNGDKQECHSETMSDLQIYIVNANEVYPQALGNGIRLDSIELEGNFLVYHSSLEEQEISIKTISDNAESVKKSMLKALAHSGDYLQLCKKYQKGLIFRYHGLKSGKTFGIILSPEEMALKK